MFGIDLLELWYCYLGCLLVGVFAVLLGDWLFVIVIYEFAGYCLMFCLWF